ncbi:glycine-rich domain-containing protein [Candidatus Nanosalina sp. VS9-1]|uniref:glycine-rich domain-containing protein n=1 Tax=Candidatus Nanosalina sp. VS9-1 TaxID=3388566 RepID=UPI0039DFFE39
MGPVKSLFVVFVFFVAFSSVGISSTVLTDDFCSSSNESSYVKTEHTNRGGNTNGGWIWDESSCVLESDDSNDDLAIHVDPADISLPESFRFESDYLGAGDNDASGLVLYDESENRWWTATITNDHGVNGIGYIEGGDVSGVSSGKNFDVGSPHEFAVEYSEGMMEFYVDGEISASHDIGVEPDSIGFISDAQNPSASFDNLNVTGTEDVEKIHYSTTGGSTQWTPPSGVNSVDILLVGGGGGGGADNGGGGGAGGIVYREGVSVDPSQDYSIDIGAGGAGGTQSGTETAGENGGDTSAFGFTALGGGGGAAGCGDSSVGSATDGGSGGGGSGECHDTPGSTVQNDTTDGLGNNGGMGDTGSGAGAGGGGAAEPGEDGYGAGGRPGDGGDGKEYCIAGKCIYYAGGGGGGPENDISVEAGYGEGGLGGGGDGALGSAPPEDGVDGFGGGGGGMGYAGSDSHSGGDGGDGVVVIRYNTEFCNERGPLNECIMNAENDLASRTYTINSVFDVRREAILRSSGQTSLNVTNSTELSGLWKGGFDIKATDIRLIAGARFMPEGASIVLGK